MFFLYLEEPTYKFHLSKLPLTQRGEKIKTRAESGCGVVLGCWRKQAAASLSPAIVCLFSCQLGKTKVELNEANEEAPHLALLV